MRARVLLCFANVCDEGKRAAVVSFLPAQDVMLLLLRFLVEKKELQNLI